jgi:hypothetical protein
MVRLLILAARRPEVFRMDNGAAAISDIRAELIRETVGKSSVRPIYERIYPNGSG